MNISWSDLRCWRFRQNFSLKKILPWWKCCNFFVFESYCLIFGEVSNQIWNVHFRRWSCLACPWEEWLGNDENSYWVTVEYRSLIIWKILRTHRLLANGGGLVKKKWWKWKFYDFRVIFQRQTTIFVVLFFGKKTCFLPHASGS